MTYRDEMKRIVRDYVEGIIAKNGYKNINPDFVLDNIGDPYNLIPSRSSDEAKEMVFGNPNEITEIFREIPHITSETVASLFLAEDWKEIDNIAREYFIYDAVVAVTCEIEEEMKANNFYMLTTWFRQNCDEITKTTEDELISQLKTIRTAMPGFYNALVSAAIK